jgi:hypothetical protein
MPRGIGRCAKNLADHLASAARKFSQLMWHLQAFPATQTLPRSFVERPWFQMGIGITSRSGISRPSHSGSTQESRVNVLTSV